MYRDFSRFQMCFSLCSIGLQQRGKIWVKMAESKELITFAPMFSYEKCAMNNFPSGPCSKDTWLANPHRFVCHSVLMLSGTRGKHLHAALMVFEQSQDLK